MNSKEFFNKNKALRDQLIAVINTDWFAECLLYVRSALIESSITAEQLAGAKRFQQELMTITDPEYKEPEPMKTGLIHVIDNPKAERTQTK